MQSKVSSSRTRGLLKRLRALQTVLQPTAALGQTGKVIEISGEAARIIAAESERILNTENYADWNVGQEFNKQVVTVATPVWNKMLIGKQTFAWRNVVEAVSINKSRVDIMRQVMSNQPNARTQIQRFDGRRDSLPQIIPKGSISLAQRWLLGLTNLLPQRLAQLVHSLVQNRKPLGYLEYTLRNVRVEAALAKALLTSGSPVQEAYIQAALAKTSNPKQHAQRQLELVLSMIRFMKESQAIGQTENLQNMVFFSRWMDSMPAMITAAIADRDRSQVVGKQLPINKLVVPILLMGRGRSGALGALTDMVDPMLFVLHDDIIQRFRRKGFHFSFKSAA